VDVEAIAPRWLHRESKPAGRSVGHGDTSTVRSASPVPRRSADVPLGGERKPSGAESGTLGDVPMSGDDGDLSDAWLGEPPPCRRARIPAARVMKRRMVTRIVQYPGAMEGRES
jgi:hypothetical protein